MLFLIRRSTGQVWLFDGIYRHNLPSTDNPAFNPNNWIFNDFYKGYLGIPTLTENTPEIKAMLERLGFNVYYWDSFVDGIPFFKNT